MRGEGDGKDRGTRPSMEGLYSMCNSGIFEAAWTLTLMSFTDEGDLWQLQVYSHLATLDTSWLELIVAAYNCPSLASSNHFNTCQTVPPPCLRV